MASDRIKKIFKAFDSMYGKAWSSRHSTEESWQSTMRVWDRGLSRYTDEQIKIALGKCAEKHQYPPNLPEFIALCEPDEKDLGIPTVEQAYRHAACSEWVHPIVYHAAKEIGTYEIRFMDSRTGFARFKPVYEKLVNEMRRGRVFEFERHPEDVLLESDETTKRCPPEVAKKYLDEIKNMLGMNEEGESNEV